MLQLMLRYLKEVWANVYGIMGLAIPLLIVFLFGLPKIRASLVYASKK